MVADSKTRSIFERYNIKSEDDLREAAERIANSAGNSVIPARAPVVHVPAIPREAAP
jgi:hypothetical protein